MSQDSQVTICEFDGGTGRFGRTWKKRNTDLDFPTPLYVGGK